MKHLGLSRAGGSAKAGLEVQGEDKGPKKDPSENLDPAGKLHQAAEGGSPRVRFHPAATISTQSWKEDTKAMRYRQGEEVPSPRPSRHTQRVHKLSPRESGLRL